MEKIGILWGNYKIMACYNIVPIQYTKVVSSVMYVRLTIHCSTMCIGINFFMINEKRWNKY